MVALLFIHSVTGALIAAMPIGLMGGVASAAYLDLIIPQRSRSAKAGSAIAASAAPAASM
jgi:hypothetical protein